jgi:hypothetical protein
LWATKLVLSHVATNRIRAFLCFGHISLLFRTLQSDAQFWCVGYPDRPPVDLLRPYDAEKMTAWKVDKAGPERLVASHETIFRRGKQPWFMPHGEMY